MVESIVIQIIVAIVMALAASALAPKPKVNRPDPGSLETPRIKSGSPAPVIFGTVRIKSPFLIWYGDASNTAIRTKTGK